MNVLGSFRSWEQCRKIELDSNEREIYTSKNNYALILVALL